jgi:hypothetical protein
MYSFELNNAQRHDDLLKNTKLNKKSPIVEIFSAIAEGKDVSKYGKKVDKVVETFKDLAERSAKGDVHAKAEINTIVRYAVEPKLLNMIQLLSFMGQFHTIQYHEQPRIRKVKHESIRSNFQATHGDVSFATQTWDEKPVNTQTISSGMAVDYREIAAGNFDGVGRLMQDVQTDMHNKAMNYVVTELYNAIKNATGIKYFSEAAGIQQSAVDDAIKKVRRFGRVTIFGDYSVVSQLNDFAGFKADPADSNANQLAEAVMEEIRKTGLLSAYKGAAVVEIPNTYNLTKKNTAGDNFDLYLPEGLLFFIPQGAMSPLHVFQRGGLTSMTGQHVETGTEVTRFDLEIGAGVETGEEYRIGLVSDTNFDAPSY